MATVHHTRPRRQCGATQTTAWVPRPRAHPDVSDPWRLVERRQTGVLRYARARGTMALPVRYVTRDRRLYFRLPAYNDACHFIDRADVAMEVAAATSGREAVVRVAGVGLLIAPALLPAGLSATIDQWPPDIPTSTIVLVPESVQTVSTSDDRHHPPLPCGPRLPGTFVDPYGLR